MLLHPDANLLYFFGAHCEESLHTFVTRGAREGKGVEIINSRSWDVSQMCVMCIPSLRDSRQLINQNNARGNALVCKEKRHLKIP